MSHTYTATVKPNFSAFSAILRFDPEAWIEFETGDETAETFTINSAYALDHLLDDAPGIIEWDDLRVRGFVVTAGENGFLAPEANQYIRANGGENHDYSIQNYDSDDQPYLSHFTASSIEFETLAEAENFCERFYSQYVPENEFPVDPWAPHYYRNALHIVQLGEWSGA